MAVYNVTNITGSINVLEQAVAVNDMSNGLLGIMFLISIAAILFMTFQFTAKLPVPASLAGTTWFTVIIAFMLLAMGLVEQPIVLVSMIAAIGSLIFLYISKGAGG